MEKIIKFTIENTTKTREVEETYSELYSHDRNNGLFEFEIANEQLAGKNLIALFKFVKTGSYWKTEAVVEDNKAKIKFDTSLITQNEKVICFIYVNEEIRDADIFRFKFNVRVSEIDKAKQLPLKERFYAHGLIVDRLDVLTKEDFDNAIKEIEKGSKFLTEAQANEKYALKGDIPNVSDFVSSEHLSDYALKTEIPDSETIVNKAVGKVEKKGYLTQHQSLAGYVTETQLTGKGYLTEHQDISKLATKKSVEDVEAKVTQLENRPVTSSYDDSEIKREIKELKDRPVIANIDTSNFVTNTQLEDKHYLTEHQSLEDYVTKNELDNKHYLTTHQDISNLATKQELQEVSNRQVTIDTSNLATKEELQAVSNRQVTVDTSNLATKEELRKAFLDEEDQEKYAKKTELPQPYNDTDITNRLTALENRPTGSGNVDTNDFATKQELKKESGRIDTLEFNTKTTVNKFEAPFKTTGITNPYDYFRANYTGSSSDHYGTIYSNANERIIISGTGKHTNLDTALYTLASSLPDGYTPDFEFSEGDNLKFITTQSINNYIPQGTGNTGNTEKITALDNRLKVLEANTGNTTELDKRLKVLEAKNWEIHGRGMPNGVVTAPVGTTYVDEAVTNGALKWIKKSGTGNTGWEVLIGDTGWKILPSVSKLGNSFVKIRRVNNVVSYQFGGLSWGWFGIVRRGGAGYVLQGSDRERNCYIIQNNGIPAGYRTEASLIGNIYNDKGIPYGTWYLGGVGDYNQLRFQFTDPVPTDRDIGDIRISSISYLTNEPWPQN